MNTNLLGRRCKWGDGNEYEIVGMYVIQPVAFQDELNLQMVEVLLMDGDGSLFTANAEDVVVLAEMACDRESDARAIANAIAAQGL